jgi:hypothetical protein
VKTVTRSLALPLGAIALFIGVVLFITYLLMRPLPSEIYCSSRPTAPDACAKR